MFRMQLLGEFKLIFPDEIPMLAEEYLSTVDKETILRLSSFLSGQIISISKYYDWKEFLNMWFSESNRYLKDKIWNRCLEVEKSMNVQLTLISPVASLRFFEVVYSLPLTVLTGNNATSEVNLFKAYLLFLTMTHDRDGPGKKYLNTLPDDGYKVAATLLNNTYPTSEFTNYDLGQVFNTQIIKAFYLFRFLETRSDACLLFSKFLEHFQIGKWRDYFQSILPLVAAHATNSSDKWMQITVARNDKFDQSCRFLDALSVYELDTELNADYKVIRARPLYQIEQGLYAVIFPLFIYEKIFKGLYFKLKELNDGLPDGDGKIKNLRSFFTTNFSEKYLLYQVMDYIYGKKAYIRFTGEDLANKGFNGAPDYYMRNGKHVFLFENKDVFIWRFRS